MHSDQLGLLVKDGSRNAAQADFCVDERLVVDFVLTEGDGGELSLEGSNVEGHVIARKAHLVDTPFDFNPFAILASGEHLHKGGSGDGLGQYGLANQAQMSLIDNGGIVAGRGDAAQFHFSTGNQGEDRPRWQRNEDSPGAVMDKEGAPARIDVRVVVGDGGAEADGKGASGLLWRKAVYSLRCGQGRLGRMGLVKVKCVGRFERRDGQGEEQAKTAGKRDAGAR